MTVVAQLLRRPDLAVVRYERALKLFPQYALTHGQYGMFLVDIGQVKMGIARLNKAVQMEPKNQTLYKMLARAYTKVGNPAKAREVIETGKRLASQSTTQGSTALGKITRLFLAWGQQERSPKI